MLARHLPIAVLAATAIFASACTNETASEDDGPVAGDENMEAWFGDAINLSYQGKSAGATKIEQTINVVKGTDGNLLVFEKKYATEKVAIESQFRMAEAYFELFKNYRALKQDAQATNASIHVR